MRLRIAAVLAGLVLLLAIWLSSARHYVDGFSLVVHIAETPSWARRLTAWRLQTHSIAEHEVPTRHGSLRAKIYRPEKQALGAIVFTPGLHPAGFDELRLVGFASRLAAHGFVVVSPDYPDLNSYRITSRTSDQIEDAALWASSREELAADGRIGLIGVSFGGGLSVVAAGRPELAERIRFVVSLGGHGDLPRVLRFLCTGRLPDGGRLQPHDYGVALLLHSVADRVVPAEQVVPLRQGIRMFLHAASRRMFDPAGAQNDFALAREYAATLPEPAARLLAAVNRRDVETLGTLLLPYAEDAGGDPDLSPERVRGPTAPVYLLHGAGDQVIPAVESTLLARHLARQTRVHRLASPLITHAETDRPTGPREVWDLIAFWGRLLAE